MLNNDQKAMHVLATTLLQHWRNKVIAFLDHLITVNGSYMHSFDSAEMADC
jgi:hypothetical protein